MSTDSIDESLNRRKIIIKNIRESLTIRKEVCRGYVTEDGTIDLNEE